MVKVTQAKVWNQATGQFEVERGWFTVEGIERIRMAHSIPGTDRDVDESKVNEDGRYMDDAASARRA